MAVAIPGQDVDKAGARKRAIQRNGRDLVPSRSILASGEEICAAYRHTGVDGAPSAVIKNARARLTSVCT